MAFNKESQSGGEDLSKEIFTDPVGFRTRSQHKASLPPKISTKKDELVPKFERLPSDTESSSSSPLSSVPSEDPPSPKRVKKKVTWADEVGFEKSEEDLACKTAVSSGEESLPAEAGSTSFDAIAVLTDDSFLSAEAERLAKIPGRWVDSTTRSNPSKPSKPRATNRAQGGKTSSAATTSTLNNGPRSRTSRVQRDSTSSMTAGSSAQFTQESESQGDVMDLDTELDMRQSLIREPRWATSSLRETQRREWIEDRLARMPFKKRLALWCQDDIL